MLPSRAASRGLWQDVAASDLADPYLAGYARLQQAAALLTPSHTAGRDRRAPVGRPGRTAAGRCVLCAQIATLARRPAQTWPHRPCSAASLGPALAWPRANARPSPCSATAVFAPARLHETIDQMLAGQQDTIDTGAAEAAIAQIEDIGRKMGRYRAALDAGGDPEEIGKWIA